MKRGHWPSYRMRLKMYVHNMFPPPIHRREKIYHKSIPSKGHLMFLSIMFQPTLNNIDNFKIEYENTNSYSKVKRSKRKLKGMKPVVVMGIIKKEERRENYS